MSAVLGRLHPHEAAGRVVGDFLDKPPAQGGLALSRAGASAVLALAIATLILVMPQRPAETGARDAA